MSTAGYLIQNYYRCQHNTRRWNPNKDPQRKLHTNPAARMKNTNCSLQLLIKINTSGICFVDIDWGQNHNKINLKASNFNDISYVFEVLSLPKRIQGIGNYTVL